MIGKYTLAELRRFLEIHDRLNDGELTKADAVTFAMLGWIRQVEISPPRFVITDLGQHQVDNPLPPHLR